jgi:hypothetical protein
MGGDKGEGEIKVIFIRLSILTSLYETQLW